MANEKRDRLAELYAKAKRNAWGRTFHSDLERNMYIADYLIANDVVPVVRCKNCRNRFEKNWSKCRGRKPDDYCSDGERRYKNGENLNIALIR